MYYNRNRIGQLITRVALTLCLSLALCLNMGIPSLSAEQTSGRMTELFWNIATSLTEKSCLATLLFGVLLSVNRRIDGRKTERRILFPLVGGGIALIWLMGEGFRVDNTLWILYASFGQMMKSAIYLVGITYGLNQIAYFLYIALEEQEPKRLGSTLVGKETWWSHIVRTYREHTVLVSFGTIFILWLPHLILAYPANFCSDANSQLAQFFGLKEYSSHHPIISTLIMGGLVKVGALISGNFGLFLYIAVQTVLGAWILAYTLHLMRELNAPIWLRVVSFGCYIFVPYYTAYIGVFLKDVPYSYAVLLFVSELVYFLIRSEDFVRSKRHLFLLTVSIVGSIFLRNNGKYMLYPTIAAVLLYQFFCNRKSKMDFKRRRHILGSVTAIFLMPVLLAEGFSASLMSYLNVNPGSSREALSLPMQQTARYVKEFGDEITEDEKAVISTVLDYENLAEKYDPRISDPVKRTFKSMATPEELKDYLLVWMKQFAKHPLVYFEATLNQNYYLLYPYVANNTIYVNRISDSMDNKLIERLELSDVETIANLKTPLEAFYKMSFYFPGLNVLSHPAFYMTLLIWLSLFSIYRKRFLWLLVSVPLWLSAMIIVLAPAIQRHPRYAFPIIYSMPVLLAYFLYLGRNKSET